MSAKQPKPKNKSPKDFEELGKILTNVYESGYLDRGTAYKMSFLKGVLSGIGGVIGATLVLVLLLWLLSILDDIPLIGRVFENLRQTVESKAR